MRWIAWMLLFTTPTVVLADKTVSVATTTYTDDAALLEKFTKNLGKLAEKGECAFGKELGKKCEENRTFKLDTLKSSDKALSPEDLAEKIKPSVFIIGSVLGDKDKGFEQGRLATAWVIGAEGYLMTNWHVLEAIEDDEHFGVMNHEGKVFAMTDVMAMNKLADVAIIRITAKDLTPLPLAAVSVKVGSWVGVLGHPADRYYTFTQGHATRYSQFKNDDGEKTRWLNITAEYAYGSSGSPVINSTGAVVGMAALTESVDFPEEVPVPQNAKRMLRAKQVRSLKKDDDKKKEDKKPDAAPAPAAFGSTLQMVVKLAAPLDDIRALVAK
jgi:serine protease Do